MKKVLLRVSSRLFTEPHDPVLCYVAARAGGGGACLRPATQFTPRGQPICDECARDYDAVMARLNVVLRKLGMPGEKLCRTQGN